MEQREQHHFSRAEGEKSLPPSEDREKARAEQRQMEQSTLNKAAANSGWGVPGVAEERLGLGGRGASWRACWEAGWRGRDEPPAHSHGLPCWLVRPPQAAVRGLEEQGRGREAIWMEVSQPQCCGLGAG